MEYTIYQNYAFAIELFQKWDFKSHLLLSVCYKADVRATVLVGRDLVRYGIEEYCRSSSDLLIYHFLTINIIRNISFISNIKYERYIDSYFNPVLFKIYT